MPQTALFLQQFSESLLFALLQIGLTVSLIGFVLLLLRRVLQKRYPARIICLIWALLAVRLIIPVQLTLPHPPVIVTPRLHYVQWDDTTAETSSASSGDLQQPHAQWLSETELQAATIQSHTPSALHLSSLFLFIWLTGTGVFLWHELHTYFSFKRRLCAALHAPSSSVLQHIFDEECATAGIKRQPTLAVSAAVSCPQLLSARRPLLVLPHEQFADEDICFVLRHELTHLHHGDLWLKYLLVLARAMHWFNPLIHLLAHAANEDIELACDSAVAASLSMDERKRYGHTILNAAIEQRLHTSMVSCFTGDKETLMKRFEHLFDKHTKKKGLALILTITLLTVGCGSAFAIGYTSPSMPTDQERIALAEAWGAQKYGAVIHTIKLDEARTLFVSEPLSNGTAAPCRTAEELHFTQENGIWKVSDSTILAEGDVQTLEEFLLLYENDLGLPADTVTSKPTSPLNDSNTDDVLHLKGGKMEMVSQQDVSYDGEPDLLNMRYTFADGSTINLQMAGGNIQSWSDTHEQNHRTATDLAQQFARAISYKNVWYLYPVLSEQGQLALARHQQELVGSAPDGVWYRKLGGSSPSYHGYRILPAADDPLSCIVVFQMYGGGWTDVRCAYRVTIGSEHDRSVIESITLLTNETHTNRELFDLYYHTDMPLFPIDADMNHYNGIPMESLTTPDGAARAIFQINADKNTEVTSHGSSFSDAKVKVLTQNRATASVLLTFADGSGSATIEMFRIGEFWCPTEQTATTQNHLPQ